MPTATAAFSDSTAGEIGIETRRAAAARIAADAPRPSLPTASTNTSAGASSSKRSTRPSRPGFAPSSSQSGSLPRLDARRGTRPRCRARTGSRARSRPTPAAPSAPSGSAVPSAISTPDAPNAAATRRIAPTLPGSWTPSSSRSGRRAPRTRSASDHAGSSATASTPCGVTASADLVEFLRRRDADRDVASRRPPRASASATSAARSSASHTSRTGTCPRGEHVGDVLAALDEERGAVALRGGLETRAPGGTEPWRKAGRESLMRTLRSRGRRGRRARREDGATRRARRRGRRGTGLSSTSGRSGHRVREFEAVRVERQALEDDRVGGDRNAGVDRGAAQRPRIAVEVVARRSDGRGARGGPAAGGCGRCAARVRATRGGRAARARASSCARACRRRGPPSRAWSAASGAGPIGRSMRPASAAGAPSTRAR